MLLVLVKLEKTVGTDPSHHPRYDDDCGDDHDGGFWSLHKRVIFLIGQTVSDKNL